MAGWLSLASALAVSVISVALLSSGGTGMAQAAETQLVMPSADAARGVRCS